MSLDHTEPGTNLLSPQVADDSNKLTPDQCTQARKSLQSDWPKMLR